MTEKHDDPLVLPGHEPTDEDLRRDAELTRQELAETVAALGEKADVRTRVRQAAHERTEALRERGDELVERLPDPVADKVRPAVETAARKPVIPVATVLALLVLLRVLLRRGRSGRSA